MIGWLKRLFSVLSPGQLMFVILAGVEVPQVLSAYEPSPFTMATFAADPEKIKWIRHGYWSGGGIALAFAAAMSLAAHHPAPIIVASGVLAFTIAFYEWAIRHGRAHGTDMRSGSGAGSGASSSESAGSSFLRAVPS